MFEVFLDIGNIVQQKGAPLSKKMLQKAASLMLGGKRGSWWLHGWIELVGQAFEAN